MKRSRKAVDERGRQREEEEEEEPHREKREVGGEALGGKLKVGGRREKKRGRNRSEEDA